MNVMPMLLPALADAVSSSSTPDLSSATESAKGAASDLKAKAKSVLKGNSALPNSIATVADLNADVRGLSENYRDPAGAIQQDKAAGGVIDQLAVCHMQYAGSLHCFLNNSGMMVSPPLRAGG